MSKSVHSRWRKLLGPHAMNLMAPVLCIAAATNATAQLQCTEIGTAHAIDNGTPQPPAWGNPNNWANSSDINQTPGGCKPASGTNLPDATTRVYISNKTGSDAVSLLYDSASNIPQVNPIIDTLNITNSTLTFSGPGGNKPNDPAENSTLTTNELNLSNSTLDGSYHVTTTPLIAAKQGFGTVNILSNPNFPNGISISNIANLTSKNTSLTFGTDAQANFSGTLDLEAYNTNFNHAIITGSPNTATTFNNVGITGNGALVETGGGMFFTGANAVTGITLQGNITIGGSSTIFTATNLQGVLATSGGANIIFDNGTMSQSSATGAPAPGFVQTGSGTINIVNLTATAGTFDGAIHLTDTNNLTGVTVNAGAVLSVDTGTTTFTGNNNGTLSALGQLVLTGVVSNPGSIQNAGVGGSLLLQDANVNGGGIAGDVGSLGASTLNNVRYSGNAFGNTLTVQSGTLTLQDFNNGGNVLANGGSLVLAGHVTGGNITSTLNPIQLSSVNLENTTISASSLVATGSNLLGNGLVLSNSGSLQIASGETTIAGILDLKQDYSISVAGGAQLVNQGTLVADAKLTISGAVNNNLGNILQAGGSLLFQDASVTGGVIGNGGSFGGTNTLSSVVLNGTSLVTNGTTTLNNSTNNGILTLQNSQVNPSTLILTGDTRTGTINGSTPQSVQLNGANLFGGTITGGLIANGTNAFNNVQLAGNLEIDSGHTNGSGLSFTGPNPAFTVKGGTLLLGSSTTAIGTVGALGELDLAGNFTIAGVTSAGNITALSGAPTVSSLNTTGGILQANTGAVLGIGNSTIVGTALMAQPGGSFQATGLNTLFNSSLTGGGLTVQSGTTSLTGALNATGGLFAAANSGTLDLTGATITGGSFSTSGNGVIQAFAQNVLLGSGPQGNFNSSLNGSLVLIGSDWNPGSGATTLIGQGGTLALTSGAVHNEGGVIDIESGGLLTAPTLFVQDSGSTMVHGTLHVGSSSAPGDIEIDGGSFTYDSIQDIFGNLTFADTAAGLVVNDSGIFGSVSLDAFSTLTGSHVISGDLANDGVVQPGDASGNLTVRGDYTQSAQATLTFELGPGNSDVPNQLLISGTADLAGTLDLTSLDGFQPEAGDSFKLIEFASSQGAFSQVNLNGIGDSDFTVLYDSHDVTIEFGQAPAPEASSWVLMGGGLIALGLWRRQRRL